MMIVNKSCNTNLEELSFIVILKNETKLMIQHFLYIPHFRIHSLFPYGLE